MIAIPLTLTVIIGLVTAVSNENVMITSTISEQQHACPGERVVFTCVTRGSLIISWKSNEYIGAGGTRVEFAAVDVGKIALINSNATATLVSAEVINGTRILTSQLMIIARPEYQNPSITCLHVGLLINATTSFQLLGIPEMALETVAIELLEKPREECTIFMHWKDPNNTARSDINHYRINIEDSSIPSILNFTAANDDHSKVLFLSKCNIQSISLRAVDRCEREGLLVIIPLQRVFVNDIDNIISTVTATTYHPKIATDLLSMSDISIDSNLVTLPIISLIMSIIAIIAIGIIVLFLIQKYRPKRNRDPKMDIINQSENLPDTTDDPTDTNTLEAHSEKEKMEKQIKEQGKHLELLEEQIKSILEKMKEHQDQPALVSPTIQGPVAATPSAENQRMEDAGASTEAATGPEGNLITPGAHTDLGDVDLSSGPGSTELKEREDMVGEEKGLGTSPSKVAMTIDETKTSEL